MLQYLVGEDSTWSCRCSPLRSMGREKKGCDVSRIEIIMMMMIMMVVVMMTVVIVQ